MVAKFLDDNKSKRHSKSGLALLQIHRSYFISFNLQMLAKFSGLNLKGPYLSLEKDKEIFCVVLTYPIKRARQIRKFHVAVVQRRLRNIQKRVMHVQSCYFANINLFLFYRSR